MPSSSVLSAAGVCTLPYSKGWSWTKWDVTCFASYTPEAWAAMIKNPQNRRELAAGALEAVGGKLLSFDFAFGESDVLLPAEVPDNISAAAVAMATAASGSLRSLSTTPLMTAEEAMDAMRMAATIAYRRPGS